MPAPPASPAPGSQRGTVAAMGWACYLGCSWTWIIGMVFPVLLLRDHGAAGWVVFAIPNVLGAAAMGLVLWKPDTSARILARHGDMARRFSEVTVAYHAFVLGWLIVGIWGLWAALAAVLLTAICWHRIRGDRAAWQTAALIAAASLLLLGSAAALDPGRAWIGVFQQADTWSPRLDTLDLVLFAPAALMGFALCPYLDLTFHRARIATGPATGAIAFVLGFGVVFLAMIIGSLMYAGLLAPDGKLFDAVDRFTLPGPWHHTLAAHMTLQLGFTLAVHGREIARTGTTGSLGRLGLISLAALIVGCLLQQRGGDTGMSPGETVYRLFLLCYGLVFPAYVWLCMIPTIRPTHPRTRRSIFVFAVLVSFPMGWLFFISGQSAWIIAILATFAALRVVVETTPRYIEAPLQSPPDP